MEEIFFNTGTSLTADAVDKINDRFYSRFNFPWVPTRLPTYEDPGFWPRALNQDLGYFGTPRFANDMTIWVAGCGTNQAVLTALKFPHAQVIGTDISTGSLRACARIVDQIGLKNLTLKQESLNDAAPANAFDYVICTGVIHHNADPRVPLENIARSLKKHGVVELMVYNYYHRIQTTAFQKAIRVMGDSREHPDTDRELPLAQRFIESFPTSTNMGGFLDAMRNLPEAAVADSLLQPVEYSYTVASLNELALKCGLRLITPCVNQFDRAFDRLDWEMPLADETLRRTYDALPDIDRWQVTNLMMGETSPMLWFYLQPQNAEDPVGAQQLATAFLNTVFVPDGTTVCNYLLTDEDRYELSQRSTRCPAPTRPKDATAAAVFDACDGKRTIADILQGQGRTPDFRLANSLRLHLASNGHPYLRSAEV